jgi:hypothetical protein
MSIRQEVLKLFPWLSCEHHEDVVKFIESRTPAPAPSSPAWVELARLVADAEEWRGTNKSLIECLGSLIEGCRRVIRMAQQEAPSPKVDMGPWVEAIRKVWPCGICLDNNFNPHDGTCPTNGSAWGPLRAILSSTPPDPSSAAKEAVNLLRQMVKAMKRYECGADCEATSEHRGMMDNAEDFLARLAALDQEKP